MYYITISILQMCNYKIILMHDIHILIEITLKYILVYYKCLSEHLSGHFNHISKTTQVIMIFCLNIY